MPRHKNNPTFDPAKLEAEVLKTDIELFNSKDNPNHDISFIADELQISDLKARKLLITAGERDKHIYYSSPLADQIQTLRAEGRSLKETEEIIHDITKENLSQVPASRGSNKIEFIVVHYLGVPNADNPYLYGGSSLTVQGEVTQAVLDYQKTELIIRIAAEDGGTYIGRYSFETSNPLPTIGDQITVDAKCAGNYKALHAEQSEETGAVTSTYVIYPYLKISKIQF